MKKVDARLRFGRKLNLTRPRNLADKVSWLSLQSGLELEAACTDKFDVRAYVVSKGLGDILVPLCGGPWESVGDIDFDSLPKRFALKATHSCGMNLICPDKAELNVRAARREIATWLRQDYARACIEPHYRLIRRRVYCEEYLDDPNAIVDYKVHCFSGEPAFILTCTERTQGLQLNLYDTSWSPMAGLVRMRNKRELDPPSRLDDMLQISRRLSMEFRFVRVDLYQIGDEIRFGELTFTPAAGVFPYFSEEFLAEQGGRLEVL